MTASIHGAKGMGPKSLLNFLLLVAYTKTYSPLKALNFSLPFKSILMNGGNDDHFAGRITFHRLRGVVALYRNGLFLGGVAPLTQKSDSAQRQSPIFVLFHPQGTHSVSPLV